MSQIVRIYTFTDGTKAYSAHVNVELNQIVAAFNASDTVQTNMVSAVSAIQQALLTIPTSANIKGIRLSVDNVIETTINGTAWFATGSSGHLILDGVGTEMPQRARLQFAGQTTVTDDGVKTIITGLKGDTGATGPQGAQGNTGAVGGQGPIGKVITPLVDPTTGIITWTFQNEPLLPSAVNIRGPQGPQGVSGSQGPQGVQGIAGPTGSQGPTGATGAKGDDGANGQSFTVLSLYATLMALQTAHAVGSAGQAYAVGTAAANVIYIWSVDTTAWVSIGDIQGPQGAQGPQGVAGPQGAQGVAGPQGTQGQQGVQGIQGLKGDTGTAGANGLTTSVNGVTQVGGAITLVAKDIGDPSAIEKIASYTLALVDGTTVQRCNSGIPITITIPTNAAVAFPIKTEIAIVRYGTGSVYVSPTGVTLRSDTSKYYVKNQYGSAVLKKIATDEWLLVGSIE